MPVYFFLAGAGTGKSRNATEFHSTTINCLPTTMDETHELRVKLKNAWVFNTTLENGTPWCEFREPDPYEAIGSRMLYQLLHDTTTWNDIIKTYEAPTPEDILRLVAKHYTQ